MTLEPRFTPRLRLEPIGPEHGADLWLVHTDDAVVPWYDGWRPSRAQADERAQEIAAGWREHGVHKWMAYERASGEVVGRGGLSRTPVDHDWGQCYEYLPHEAWVRAAHPSTRPFRAHAHWVEIGWALRGEFWGAGYASEIGRAGLDFAFDTLAVEAVVACTARHNARSRAVMRRIGMREAGEIRTRGIAEGERELRTDAPFTVSVVLAADRAG